MGKQEIITLKTPRSLVLITYWQIPQIIIRIGSISYIFKNYLNNSSSFQSEAEVFLINYVLDAGLWIVLSLAAWHSYCKYKQQWTAVTALAMNEENEQRVPLMVVHILRK